MFQKIIFRNSSVTRFSYKILAKNQGEFEKILIVLQKFSAQDIICELDFGKNLTPTKSLSVCLSWRSILQLQKLI